MIDQFREGTWFFREGESLIDQSQKDPIYVHAGMKFISISIVLMRNGLQVLRDKERETFLRSCEKYERDVQNYFRCDIDNDKLMVRPRCCLLSIASRFVYDILLHRELERHGGSLLGFKVIVFLLLHR